MFYSDFVLSKKGPLARIWLAAHWDKKLTKAQIFETNIESSIEKILRPKMKLALRTSGHLMLGVVRIYSRKTKYLLADCNEAFVKIKMAFRPGMVDLPEDHREAAVNAVTLPEVFHDFDSVMPELNNMDIEVQFTLNQSRADEITMREDFDGVLPLHDDGFDLAFDASTSDALRHSVDFDQSLQHANLLFGEGIDAIDRSRDRPSTSDVNANLSNLSMDINLPKDDGFGGISGGGLFEGGLFEDVPMPSISNNSLPRDSDSNMPSTSREPVEDLNDHDFDNFDVPSPGGVSSNGSQPNSPMPNIPAEMLGNISEFDQNLAINEHSSQNQEMSEIPALENKHESDINQTAEQTTLLQNEEESFALAPMNASVSVGIPKSKRKRKLIVDEVKNISGEEMKGQLSDTSDIVTTLDLAPPTKRLMRWKETGGMEKLFTLPGKIIPATALFKNYQKHLTSISSSNEDGKVDKENRDTGLDDGVFIPPTIPTVGKRGRKRKRAVAEEQDELSNQNQNIPQYQFNNNDEGLTPAPADLNLETAPWSGVPTSNVGSHDPVISPVEDNSINSHINIEGGMTPWHNTEYENPMPVPSNTVNENLVPLPYDMNAITQNPWSTPIPQPNQMPPMFVSNQENSENKENSWNNPDNSEFNKEPDHLPSITPWHDVDYYNPMSVEPAEEQRADETEEQFEERVSNKRAGQLYSAIKIKIATGVITTFDDLIVHNPKKQVAQKFYSLLVLKKHRVLELTQEAPYDTILLTKGQNFDDPKL